MSIGLTDEFDPIPRYTADLIAQLEDQVPKPGVTASENTQKYWINMTEAQVRRHAFSAGQRALLDFIKEWQKETEGAKADNQDVEPEAQPDPFGKILDVDGNEHKSVASLHMASTLVSGPLESDDGGGA